MPADVSVFKLSSAAISATEGAEQATLTLTFQLKDKTEVRVPPIAAAATCQHNSIPPFSPPLVPIQISKDNGQSTCFEATIFIVPQFCAHTYVYTFSHWLTGFKKPALLSLNNKTTNSLRMGNIAQLAMTANKARKTFSKPTQLSVSASVDPHLCDCSTTPVVLLGGELPPRQGAVSQWKGKSRHCSTAYRRGQCWVRCSRVGGPLHTFPTTILHLACRGPVSTQPVIRETRWSVLQLEVVTARHLRC